jgi:Lysozyme like domain
MSKGQLEALWVKAGGPRASAGLAASIALAESAGNPNAENHNTDGSTDRGLWQINTVHGSQSTFDILANAQAAVAISNNGTNFSPWVTYKTGAYKSFLGASAGPTALPAGTSSSTSTSSSSPSSSAGSGAFSGTLEQLGVKALLYVGMIGGGAALLWYGTKSGLQPAKAAT